MNLDLSALSYLLLGNEGTPGNTEDAVAFSRYLTEEGISVLSQADSVMFPSATLESCQSQYGDFVNNFHALGIAVGADISADAAYAGSLAKAGTDILRTSAPYTVAAALQEPAPVQIASLEVTFDGNGAEDNSFGSQTYTNGVEGQMFSGSISKSGYIMLGWVENLDQPDPIYATNSTVSDDWIIGKNEQGITSITLYAYWQEIPVHTVVFDLNGQGEEQQIQDLMDGEIAVRPEDPVSPAGLIFAGWYLEPEAVNKYDFSSPVTSDMVLYAAWLQPEPEEQEELPLPDEHQALEPEPAPEIPEPELPSAEITVTFEGNGATDNTFAVQTFRQGNENQSFTGTIARNGYIMRGWAETPDSPEPQYPVNAEISDAWIVSKAQDNSGMLTLYAIWEQTTPGTVNIVFDTQGHGGTMQTMVIPVGSTVSMPEDPSEQGYLFMGWFTDPQFMQPFDISAPVTTNLVLYALWIPEPAYYIVSFDMQGHGTSPVAQTVEAGTAAERPVPDPAETGWLFLGWYTGPDLITVYDFSASVYADTIVYAGWREIVTQIPQQTDMNNPAPGSSSSSGQMQSSTATDLPVQYTVTFNMMGYGDQIATLSVAAGRPAQRPSDPMEKGYTFQGWYLEDHFLTAYDFSQPVVSDLQLFARWDKIIPETPAETEIETEVSMYCTVSFIQEADRSSNRR